MLLFLVGCGENYKTYSPEEKYKMIIKLEEIEKKSATTLTKEEEAFKKEMRNLLTTLKIEATKNNKAKKEFDEWKDAVVKYQREELEKIKAERKKEAEKTKFKISF